MLLGFFFFSVADMLSKLLTQQLNPFQVAWFRHLGLVTGIVVMLGLKGARVLRTRYPMLQFGRGLCVVMATVGFLGALPYVPLPNATAVGFAAPFMIAVLAALLLGERVGLKRWMAVIVGFAGTMIILRPASDGFQPATFLLLLSSAAFALRQVISRFLARSDSLSTTVSYTALTAATVLSIPLPFIWHAPEGPLQFVLLIGLACAAGCGELLMVKALEFGEASVLSPLQYTIMIWSTMWGYLVFSNLPDVWTWTGTAIVIGSGFFAFNRDTRARPTG